MTRKNIDFIFYSDDIVNKQKVLTFTPSKSNEMSTYEIAFVKTSFVYTMKTYAFPII